MQVLLERVFEGVCHLPLVGNRRRVSPLLAEWVPGAPRGWSVGESANRLNYNFLNW